MNKLIGKLTFIMVASSVAISSLAADVVLKGEALFGDMKARQIGPAVMSG